MAMAYFVLMVIGFAPFVGAANQLTQSEMDGIVSRHNALRAAFTSPCTAADMETLVWDSTLASNAQAWADGCVGDHASGAGSQFGESLWSSFGSTISASQYTSANIAPGAVDAWYSENVDVDWVTDSNGQYTQVKPKSRALSDCVQAENGACAIGHFTQVVWAKSNKIGCGVRKCQSGYKVSGTSYGYGALLVCRYLPAGNSAALPPPSKHLHMPFLAGAKCAACAGHCTTAGLCNVGVAPTRCVDTCGPCNFNYVNYPTCTDMIQTISKMFGKSGLAACTISAVSSLVSPSCDLTCGKCTVPSCMGSGSCGSTCGNPSPHPGPSPATPAPTPPPGTPTPPPTPAPTPAPGSPAPNPAPSPTPTPSPSTTTTTTTTASLPEQTQTITKDIAFHTIIHFPSATAFKSHYMAALANESGVPSSGITVAIESIIVKTLTTLSQQVTNTAGLKQAIAEQSVVNIGDVTIVSAQRRLEDLMSSEEERRRCFYTLACLRRLASQQVTSHINTPSNTDVVTKANAIHAAMNNNTALASKITDKTGTSVTADSDVTLTVQVKATLKHTGTLDHAAINAATLAAVGGNATITSHDTGSPGNSGAESLRPMACVVLAAALHLHFLGL